MQNVVEEIRYDLEADVAHLDLDTQQALIELAQVWGRRNDALRRERLARGAQRLTKRPTLHPTTRRALRRQDALQRAWRAMAELRREQPFELTRRVPTPIYPSACITIH